jgi:pyrophosphatase PpaX
MNPNTPKKLQYRGIIFDMDGTLAQTNDLIFNTFNYISQKYCNTPLTPEQITAMFGPPEDAAIQNMVPDKIYETAMQDFYRYYADNHEERADLYPGMRESLEKLKENGFNLGLFTGKGRVTTEITLKKLDIQEFFSAVVTGHDVILHKPSGEGIKKILKVFNISPSEALMVGDSVADILAATEVGVDVAAVLWDSYGYKKVIQYDTAYRFLSLGDFHAWINSITGNGIPKHS